MAMDFLYKNKKQDSLSDAIPDQIELKGEAANLNKKALASDKALARDVLDILKKNRPKPK